MPEFSFWRSLVHWSGALHVTHDVPNNPSRPATRSVPTIHTANQQQQRSEKIGTFSSAKRPCPCPCLIQIRGLRHCIGTGGFVLSGVTCCLRRSTQARVLSRALSATTKMGPVTKMNQHHTEPTPHGYTTMASRSVTVKMDAFTSAQKTGRASETTRRDVAT